MREGDKQHLEYVLKLYNGNVKIFVSKNHEEDVKLFLKDYDYKIEIVIDNSLDSFYVLKNK
jgi:hypothetical protein